MKGLLLIQLGSPEKPTVSACRKFLREFLMDKRVIDIPWFFRFLLVNLIICPFRSFKTAKAYQAIWRKEGSPLTYYSRQLESELKKMLEPNIMVRMAMRYGRSNIKKVWREFKENDVREVLILPLYPQYASSSSETAIEKALEVISKTDASIKPKVLRSFYDEPSLIDAFAAQASDCDLDQFDHILMSYHGLPERHLKAINADNNFCLENPHCCKELGQNNKDCYRAQCYATSTALKTKLNLPDDKVTICFQSRLGRTPWIKPYTDELILKLAKEGKRRVAVFCPSFVCDCLETLEEIGIRAKNDFMAAGGEDLVLIPSANLHPIWVMGLADFVQKSFNNDAAKQAQERII